MATPQPATITVGVGHPNYVIFTGSGDLKEIIEVYGLLFDAEVEDDTVHAIIIDPRYSTSDVMNYITELGGSVYIPPVE